MEYKRPVAESSSIEMVPYSPEFQEKYRKIYNDCYHEMREALDIKPYDYIQDDSFFETGMDKVWLLLEKDNLIVSVALKGEEIDDLIVDRNRQGQGYGRKILLWALEHVNKEKAVLRVAKWNQRAVRMYQNTGFEIMKEIEI